MALGYLAKSSSNEFALSPYLQKQTFHGISSTSTDRVLATLAPSFVSSTDASFTGRLALSAQDYAGSREGLRVEANGTAPLLGFFGAPAVARQSGDVAAGLVALGLFSSATVAAGGDVYKNQANTFTAGPQMASRQAPAEEHTSGVLGEFVADLEESLGDGFLREALVPEPQPAETVAPATHAGPAARESGRPMAPNVPAGAVVMPPAVAPAQVAAPRTVAASAAAARPAVAPSTFRASVRPTLGTAGKAEQAASVDLADMFGELRSELEEEVASADEDPETH